MIDSLNVLEIILLIIFYTSKDKALAKALVEYLDNKNKLVHSDVNQFKIYFDTIINAKK